MRTREAARSRSGKGIGSVAVGNGADSIVADRDPLCCEMYELPAIRVVYTYVGSRIGYDNGAL